MTRRRGRSKGEAQPAFVQVLKVTLKEPAWLDLSFGARCLYILLKSYYNGSSNNGRLYLSHRKAATELGCNKDSVPRWFSELETHGFIVKTKGSSLGSDGNAEAAHWRLTEIGCLGEPPTKDYRKWTPCAAKQPRGRRRPENRIPSDQSGQSVRSNQTGVSGTVRQADRNSRTLSATSRP